MSYEAKLKTKLLTNYFFKEGSFYILGTISNFSLCNSANKFSVNSWKNYLCSVTMIYK